jgi:hypothetical protein
MDKKYIEWRAKLRKKIARLQAQRELDKQTRFSRVAEVVIDALRQRGEFFFCSSDDPKQAIYFSHFDKKMRNIDSDEFRKWLGDITGLSDDFNLLGYVRWKLSIHAQLFGDLVHLASYIATHDGHIYLSCLPNSCVKIDIREIKYV